MQVFFQLTRNTFRECLREPVYFLTLAVSLLLIGLLPMAAMFVFRRQVWMILDSSLALIMLLGFVCAALCASGCIRREMTNGTVLLLLSKPVTRLTFIISKIIGINLALLIYVLLCGSAMMVSLTVSIDSFNFNTWGIVLFFKLIALCAFFGALRNYFAHRSFSANAIGAMLVCVPVYTLILYILCILPASAAGTGNANIVPFSQAFPVLLLIAFALIIMGAIAAAFSTRFSFLGVLLLCFSLFAAGMVATPWLYSVFGEGSVWASFFSALIPNWQLFWMSGALESGNPIPASYLLWSLAYTVVCSILWTIWAAALFQNAEAAKEAAI